MKTMFSDWLENQAMSLLPNVSAVDLEDYLRVVGDALEIHDARERVRHGLWKDYSAQDQCFQIKVKIDRVMRTLEIMGTPEPADGDLTDEILGELHDIINYANFSARILEGTVTR